MHRVLPSLPPALVIAVAAGLLVACADDGGPFVSPVTSIEAAKGGPGTVTVTAASPSFGNPGTINETVTITGSGFQAGAQAAWLFVNDTVDTTIAVTSTQFVNSSTLRSVISISSQSQLAFRNVRVLNADRTKGIGNSVFEVTQANPAPGAGIFRGASDSGAFVGGGPAVGGTVWWSIANGLVFVGRDSSQGQAINPLGNVIGANKMPRIYTRNGPVGSSWQLTALPASPGATEGGVWALLTDPTTGQPLVLGGRDKVGAHKAIVTEPLAWTWQAGTSSWQLQVLPFSTAGSGTAKAISSDTTMVGWIGGNTTITPGLGTTAAVWRMDPTGAWHLTVIGPAGQGGAEGINQAGTIIVGTSGGVAAYWQRGSDGSWGSPITLPGGCTDAVGVDTGGDILLGGCAFATGQIAGVLSPPYPAANIRLLGGLGPKAGAFVNGISPSGQFVGGQAGGDAAYWKMF